MCSLSLNLLNLIRVFIIENLFKCFALLSVAYMRYDLILLMAEDCHYKHH